MFFEIGKSLRALGEIIVVNSKHVDLKTAVLNRNCRRFIIIILKLQAIGGGRACPQEFKTTSHN